MGRVRISWMVVVGLCAWLGVGCGDDAEACDTSTFDFSNLSMAEMTADDTDGTLCVQEVDSDGEACRWMVLHGSRDCECPAPDIGCETVDAGLDAGPDASP